MTTNTYLLKEGFDNLKKDGSKTFSTMLIICAILLVLGIFIFILQNVNANVKVIKTESGLQAFISDTATDDDVEYMKDQIEQISGVRDVQYLSKEDAYEDAKEVFKDQSYFLDDEMEAIKPFPASFVVRFEDINQSKNIEDEISKIDGIYKVKYNETTINAIITLSKIANIFVPALAGIMLLVSVFIISNTIKLAVYSNRREIFIMKYIGATNKFIKKPFVIEGAILGLASSIISFTIISLAYVVLYARLPKIGTSLGIFGFVAYSSLWYQILAIYIFLGLFIGIFGSAMSIRKYLKV